MIANAKLRKIKERKENARLFATDFEAYPNVVPEDSAVKTVRVCALTSDQGLCGSVNSTIIRHVRDVVKAATDQDIEIITVGEKGRGGLERKFNKNFRYAITDIGKNGAINFARTSEVAKYILKDMENVDETRIVFNLCASLMSFELTNGKFYPYDTEMVGFDSFDKGEVTYNIEGNSGMMQNLHEFELGLKLYYYFTEAETSEFSSRMTSMQNSTSSAGEIGDKVQRTYNRMRQAKVTTELIEIISGAESMKEV